MPDLTGITTSRPSVSVIGPPVTNLPDLISLRLVENLAQANTLEATFNNWGMIGGQLGYLYSDGNLLHIGAGIRLSVGQVVLAEGTITALAPGFPAGTAPTFTITAEVKRPPQENTLRATQPALAVAYGALLREFHPVLHKPANQALLEIDATGVCDFLPGLAPGAALKITNLGTRWSGDYRITESILTFDLQNGMKISFAATRPRDSRPVRPR